MHLADGVLSIPVAVSSYAVTAGLLAYSIKGMQEKEIPKVSLMTGGFFAISLISIPVGPSSIHPLLVGLLGIILGRRAPVAIFVGLLLQAVLFQHGGLTTLGANTMMLALPALVIYHIFKKTGTKMLWSQGLIAGGAGVAGAVILLIVVLFFSDQRFAEGFFSVINILIAGHVPLVVIEALLTGFAIQYIYQVKPELLTQKTSDPLGFIQDKG